MNCPRSALRCPSSRRGSRERRVRAAPAVSCTKCAKKAHTSIQVQRRQSGIPCAMVLRLMPCSPRRRIRFCHRRQRIKTCPSPVGPTHLRRLGISNGCQDHTVLPYATSAVRPARRTSLTSFARPAITLRADAVASTASPPAFVTTRDPPLLPGKDGASW
jgi:hypothetical protein